MARFIRFQFMRVRFDTMKPCIFCGDPADSKEDLFPRWILKRVNTRESLYRQIGNAPPGNHGKPGSAASVRMHEVQHHLDERDGIDRQEIPRSDD